MWEQVAKQTNRTYFIFVFSPFVVLIPFLPITAYRVTRILSMLPSPTPNTLTFIYSFLFNLLANEFYWSILLYTSVDASVYFPFVTIICIYWHFNYGIVVCTYIVCVFSWVNQINENSENQGVGGLLCTYRTHKKMYRSETERMKQKKVVKQSFIFQSRMAMAYTVYWNIHSFVENEKAEQRHEENEKRMFLVHLSTHFI